jgi:hypothetical protein
MPISSASVATRRLIPLGSGRDATVGTYASGTTAARGSNRSGFDATVRRLGLAAAFAFGLGFAASRAAGAGAARWVAGARYTGGGGGGGATTRGRATGRDGAWGTGARSGFGVLGGGGGGGGAMVSGGGGGGGASSAKATPAPIPRTTQKQTMKTTRALRRELFIARS